MKNGLTIPWAGFLTERPFDLKKHSSIGVGGRARLAVYPTSEQECLLLIGRLQETDISYYVVGNMTNILPMDGETETVIVCMKKLVDVQIGKDTYVSAGAKSSEFLRACRYARKSGAEFLAGIPCTLGGALYMNAGVSGEYIAEIVKSVRVLRDGHIIDLPVEECKYSYKHSVFMERKDVILGATLRLKDASERNITEKEKYYLERRAHLPKGKSMGCVFKNPIGTTAGALIEGAGLKGLRVGGAKVSEKHANFIINEQNATAEEIKSLISLIKNAVKSQYGTELSEEIQYLN